MANYKLKSFDDIILKNLRDPEYAVAYLQDALDDSMSDFLVALGKYIRANGGMTNCAKSAGITREALHRMLSEDGNPRFESILFILKALDLHITISDHTPSKSSDRELTPA